MLGRDVKSTFSELGTSVPEDPDDLVAVQETQVHSWEMQSFPNSDVVRWGGKILLTSSMRSLGTTLVLTCSLSVGCLFSHCFDNS